MAQPKRIPSKRRRQSPGTAERRLREMVFRYTDNAHYPSAEKYVEGMQHIVDWIKDGRTAEKPRLKLVSEAG